MAPAGAKGTLSLMDIMVAYTDFDRPFATSPGVPRERVQILRDAFEKMLADLSFLTEAKKLVDWDGAKVSLYHYHATYEFPYTLGCFKGAPIALK